MNIICENCKAEIIDKSNTYRNALAKLLKAAEEYKYLGGDTYLTKTIREIRSDIKETELASNHKDIL